MHNKFEYFTKTQAQYLKQVFDIMLAPGKTVSVCLVPKNNIHCCKKEVINYACELVDFYIGSKSIVKYVYGNKPFEWYLACKDQPAEKRMNTLIDLMIYNQKKNETLYDLISCFDALFVQTQNGDTIARFAPKKHIKNTEKHQELAHYFGWKKDETGNYHSDSLGVSARIMRDMRLLKEKQNIRYLHISNQQTY